MSTIKDVAKLAGVSITTVSIVMNGNARKHSIPDDTAQKVYNAIKELNYSPNTTARRLRIKAQFTNIVFFWPSSRNFDDLSSYIEALSTACKAKDTEINLLLQVYNEGQLEQQSKAIGKNVYDAAIIMAPNEDDIHYLEDNKLSIPIVIINREVPGYPCVFYSKEKVAELAYVALSSKGIKEYVFVESDPITTRLSRAQRIISRLKDGGIEMKDEHFFSCGDTLSSGALLGENYDPSWPRCIFVDRDIAARGMLYSFNKKGLRCPEDYMMVTIASSRIENSMYSYPSLTEIVLPVQQIMCKGLTILKDLLQGKELESLHYVFYPELVYRDSLPQ